ncbi:MAG: hypothetical protein AAGA48_14560 [Myxococcota bacterium]
MRVPELWIQPLRTAEPDDDIWRVFGDWLLEQDDLRGHLVLRRHEHLTHRPSTRERLVRWGQIAEAHKRHEREWLGGAWPPTGVRLNWRDGFVFSATVETANRAAAEFFDVLLTTPTGAFFSNLRWAGTPGRFWRWLQPNLAAALHTLEWRAEPLSHGALRHLVTQPQLGGLDTLDLQGSLAEGAVGALKATTLRSLSTLAISSNPVEDEGAKVLATTQALASLRQLFAGYAGIGSPGAIALATSPWLRSLEVLSLRGNHISPNALERLSSSANLARLRTLHAHGNGPLA